MSNSDIFAHVYSRTGNNLKELVYYTTKQDEFMKMLNGALEKYNVFPIEINFYEDRGWIDCKKILKDFKK